MPRLDRDHGKGLGLLAAFPRRTLEGYFLPLRWAFALICSIALLLGAFLYAAGEAQAQIQGHGPPDKAAHEGGGELSSAQPDGRSAYQPSGGQSASHSAGHEPAQNRPVNNPNGGGNGGTHQPASQGSGYRSADHNASAPQRRTHGQPTSGQPDHAKAAHRGSVHQDPAYRRPPERGSASGSAHQAAATRHSTGRPDKSGAPGQAAPHRTAMNLPGQEKRPKTHKTTSPQSPAKHEGFTPPGQAKHQGTTEPGVTPPGQVSHQDPPKHQGTTEPGVTSPGQVSHQDPPKPAEHTGVAGPAKQKKAGSGVITEVLEEHAGGQIRTSQPASRPVGRS